jgi:leucyl aminopeptidase
MEVSVKLTVKQGDVGEVGGPAVAVNLYSGVKQPDGATKAVDQISGGLITQTIKMGGFKGDLEEVLVLYPQKKGRNVPERIVLLGLGEKSKFDAETARKLGGVLANTLRKLKVKKAATVVHGGDSGTPVRDLVRAMSEGLLIGAYRYDNHFRDGRAEELALREVTIVERLRSRVRGIREGVTLGENVAYSVNESRELVNGPSNHVTPTHMAETAKRLGRKYGFKVRVLDREQCEKEGMGAFLGVSKGSDEPCKFIVMEYAGKGQRGTVCLVGKGITFDTGGISLKPAADMDQMKYDMSGGAAVIGAMRFAASHKVPVKVVGLVAATENMPGGHAYKPGDILDSSAGVTIEVLNTDAEGRLVLADALAYARRYKPDAVIDLATLTGACVIALGSHAAGLMSNDEWLLDSVYNASVASGERAWPLPLWSEYRSLVRSDVADIKNTAGRNAGAITAGAFLGAFTNEYRWAHLDIAGVAWSDKTRPYLGYGGTGAGVRILAEFLIGWRKPRGTGPKPGTRTSLGAIPKKPARASAAKKIAAERKRTTRRAKKTSKAKKRARRRR